MVGLANKVDMFMLLISFVILNCPAIIKTSRLVDVSCDITGIDKNNVDVMVYSLVSVYILSLDFTFTPWPGFQNFFTCVICLSSLWEHTGGSHNTVIIIRTH